MNSVERGALDHISRLVVVSAHTIRRIIDQGFPEKQCLDGVDFTLGVPRAFQSFWKLLVGGVLGEYVYVYIPRLGSEVT